MQVFGETWRGGCAQLHCGAGSAVAVAVAGAVAVAVTVAVAVAVAITCSRVSTALSHIRAPADGTDGIRISTLLRRVT